MYLALQCPCLLTGHTTAIPFSVILVIKREESQEVDITYLALRPVEVVGGPGELVEVDVGADVHLARVDLHDARPRLLRRRRELDLAVEAAGPGKRGLAECQASNISSILIYL